MLKTVARLQSVVREEDGSAGGDEFMIALWHVKNASDVATVAAKLIKIVSQPYIIDDHSFTVTTSVGAGIYPAHGEDADSLMKSADAAFTRPSAQARTPEFRSRRCHQQLPAVCTLRLPRDDEYVLAPEDESNVRPAP